MEETKEEKEQIIEERLVSIKANSEKREGEEAFWMRRVPTKTLQEFKAIAEDSCKDYGMTFKMLVDHYKEWKTIIEPIMAKVLEHDKKINKINGE